jgi:hypothetical protein
VKKLDEEKKELFVSRLPKKVGRPSTCDLAKRNFCLVENFKDASAFPGSPTYNPGVKKAAFVDLA